MQKILHDVPMECNGTFLHDVFLWTEFCACCPYGMYGFSCMMSLRNVAELLCMMSLWNVRDFCA